MHGILFAQYGLPFSRRQAGFSHGESPAEMVDFLLVCSLSHVEWVSWDKGSSHRAFINNFVYKVNGGALQPAWKARDTLPYVQECPSG